MQSRIGRNGIRCLSVPLCSFIVLLFGKIVSRRLP